MYLLKKNYWWAWLLMLIGTNSASVFVLGALLEVYEKEAWYTKWQYWLIGLILFIFPACIMLVVFEIQILVNTCKKLKVPGSEIYLSPYVWLLLIIVPILGWVLLIVLILYITIWPIVMLYRGEGEKYLK